MSGSCRKLIRAHYLALGLLVLVWLGFWGKNNGVPYWTTGDLGAKQIQHEPTSISFDSNTARGRFISSAVSTTVGRDWDPHPIQALCANQTWTNDVVFECVNMHGGITNLRQEILSCMRWAIEAGAALIIPRVYLRIASNVSEAVYHKYSGTADYSVYFDRESLIERLHEACPQMGVYSDSQSLHSSKPVEDIGYFWVWAHYQHAHKDEMGFFVNSWIYEHKAHEGKTSLVKFMNAQADEICEDGPDLADTFGQLVSHRKDTRYLASAILFELDSRFQLGIDPSSKIASNAFVGIHLRTSNDTVGFEWLSSEKQIELYTAEVNRMKPRVIYVASGNLTSVDLLRASVGNIPVLTKIQLLSGQELEYFNGLTWDQQAEVDLHVLLKSSFFLGMTDSSFSWAVSNSRRSIGMRGTCSIGELENGEPMPVEDGVAYKDELSLIIGPPNKYFFRTRMWA